MNHSELPAEAEMPSFHGLQRWPPFWFFVFLALAISAIGYVAFQKNKAGTLLKEMKLLSTIADLKVEEIVSWRDERKGDAETLAQGPLFSRELERWLQDGMPPGENRSMILERLELARRAYDYREAVLFDADGKPFLSTSPDAPSLGSHGVEAVKDAMRTQSITFLDVETPDKVGNMGVAAPVFVVHDGKPQAICAIYLQIDPSRFLLPLLNTVPSTSKSTEIVLVRREGNDVLFLNASGVKEGAGFLRRPQSQSQLPAAMAVSGIQGEVEGIDYRGVSVFAALRKVPDSEWFMIVKVAKEEIYAPLRQMAWLVAGAIAGLITLTGIALALWWRNQRVKFDIAAQKQVEKNLRAASVYVRSLIEASLDPMVAISLEGKITDANKASEWATGLSRNELIGTDIDIYFTDPEKAKASCKQVIEQGFVHNFPLTIRHKSGHLLDVLYNATVYHDEAGNIQGVFASARDFTERKQAELALQGRMKELACLYAVSHDMQENLQIAEICRRAVVHLGLAMQFPEIAVPVLDVNGKRYTSGNYTGGLSHSLHAEFKTGGEAFGHLFVYYTEERPFSLPHEQNMVNAVAQAFSTWFERKRVEETLLEQEEFFRLIAENVEDFIAVLDLQGRRLYNSPSYARLFGDTEAMKGTDSFAEIHPDDRERIKKVFMETVLFGIAQRAEYRLVLASGSIRSMESSGGLIKSSQGEALRVIVVSRDVTARKQAEDEIHQLASYDALTKLPNRRLLDDRLVHTMAACKRSGRYGALMFLDMDNFKPLNDQYGHGVGDLLLIEVARRMSSCVREADTVARFGGDEFVVVLSELDVDKTQSTTQAGIVAEKIRALLAETFVLKIRPKGGDEITIEHQCTSSIGVVLFTNHETSAEDIIKCADKAMYQAKEAGRNQIHFYDAKG